jgi:uncharacterized ubiquitin-like protein YukD
VGNIYDFQLDENEKISTIVEEIGELISQKEHCRLVGDISKLMLCSMDKKSILSGDMTLYQAGIKTGNSLLLV